MPSNDGWESASDWEDAQGWESPKKKKKASLGTALHTANEQAANAIDTFLSMQLGSLSRPFSEEFSDKVYKGMEERTAARLKAANPDNEEIGLGGKVAGALATLPVQLPAMLASPADTGRTMIEQGESLPRAAAGSLIDTAGNVVGAALPGGIGGSVVKKVASGFGINAAQDALTRQAISSVAEKQGTKDILGPSLENAAVAGIVGGALGGLSPSKPVAKPMGKPKVDLAKLDVWEDAPVKSMDKAVQQELPFNTGVEEIALRQAEGSPQRDMFTEMDQAQRSFDPYQEAQNKAALADKMELERMAQEARKQEEIEAAYAQRQELEEANARQEALFDKEDALQPLQERLMEEAYVPPTKEQRRASRGRVRAKERGAINVAELSEGMQQLKQRFQKFKVEVDEAGVDGKSVTVRLKTPDDQLSGFVDFARREDGTLVAENAQVAEGLRGNGAAQRMYLAAREAGYDIAPGRVQTDLGNKMVASLQKHGLINKEAEGQRFSAGNLNLKPLEGESLPGSRYAGRSRERGVLRISPEPQKPPMAADSPEVKAAQEQLAKERRQATVGKILGDSRLDAYTTRIDTPEKVLAEIQNGNNKDIGTVQALKARSVSPGMNSVAISSNNPLLRFARDSISKVIRETDNLSRQWVTAKDGFGDKLKKLTQEEKNEVVAVLQLSDTKQKSFDAAQLREAGFNERQIDFMEHIRKMDEEKLAIWNDARMSIGLPPIKERAGHFAGNFAGDYRTLVLDKEGNPVGFIGTLTSLGNKQIQKKVKAKYPEYTFAPTKRMKLGGVGQRATMFEGLQDLVSVLAKDDPRFADIQAVVDAAMKDRGDSLYGASLHAKQKKGIWGNEGNKFWEDQKTNTNEALKAFVDYWESGIASHKNLVAEVELKGLMDNPMLDNMPNAKAYVNDYIKNFTGRSLGVVGDALNTIIDSPARWTGFGPTIPREAITQFNKRASQFTMGFINPAFLLTQYLQVAQTGLPELTKLLPIANKNPVEINIASAKIVADGLKIAKEEFTGKPANVDPFTRDAYNYAKENGLLEFSEYEKSANIFQNKVSKGFDLAADAARTAAERTTRPYVFFLTSELLKDTGLSQKEVFDMAYNMTQHSMVNYHRAEKPLMYSRLGVLGNAAGSLQTFKHAYLGQLGTFIKEAAAGKPAPLIAALVAIGVFSGIKGVPFYEELDEVVKAITDKFYADRKSISELALGNLDEWMRSGLLSVATDVNMQSRMSAADVLPDSPVEAISPFLSWGTRIGEGVVDVLDNNDPLAWSNLASAAAPSGTIKGLVDTTLKSDDAGRSLKKTGEVDYPRTERDTQIKRYTGATSLDESLNKEKVFNDYLNQKSRRDQQAKITKKAERQLAQGILTEESMKELIAEYKRQKGDPQQLVAALQEYAKTKNMTSKQRLQGVPGNSLSSIYRYQNYND